MTTTQHTNTVPTKAGKLRPVCEYCGRQGRAIDPDERGRISLWSITAHWSIAPYPADFTHEDGSTGDRFTCPSCNARLYRGESLYTRTGGTRRQVG